MTNANSNPIEEGGANADKSVLRPVDDTVRRQVKSMIRCARYAALGSLEPDGAPSVSRVALATAPTSEPGFLISRLSAHFSNLERDPRCSLLVGEPGKGDPLAYPRVTLIGAAERLQGEEAALFKARYLERHPKASLYADFADFAFWVMKPERSSFNGGFGKAYAMGPADLLIPVCPGLASMEASAVAHMNADHKDAIDKYAAMAGAQGTGWQLTSIDAEGLDLAKGSSTARLSFARPLASASELRSRLVEILDEA